MQRFREHRTLTDTEEQMEKVKDYLMGIRKAQYQIHANEETIHRINQEILIMRESILSLRGIAYDGDRVQTSAHDALSDQVARLIDSTDEFRAQLLSLYDANRQMQEEVRLRSSQIADVPEPKLRDILHKIYVEGKNMVQVSHEMSYVYHYACALHREALARFAELYPDFVEM